ncbi:MAG: PilZ domain-containing protein [Deltaproteobacteria bacterium]|nr:PilZ domain-containing protein [Deltaproteobacteria bacterium]
MGSEHRSQERYKPCNNAFISLGGGFTCVGSILDISLSGAAFEYLAYTDAQAFSGCSVDIFICGTYMHIVNMPCRVIYEQPAADEAGEELPEDTMVRKRCGIAFEPKTASHREQLTAFLNQYMQDRAAFAD